MRRIDDDVLNGVTSIHDVIDTSTAGSIESLRAALESGRYDVEETVSWRRETPLHVAAGGKKPTATIKLLVEWSARLEVRDRYGKTPLYEAIRRRNNVAIRALLEVKPDNGAHSFTHSITFTHSLIH